MRKFRSKVYRLSKSTSSLSKTKMYDVSQATIIRRSVQVFIKHYDLIGDLEALDHRVWPSYRAPETFISVDDDDVGNFYDHRLKPPLVRYRISPNVFAISCSTLPSPPLQIVCLPNILAQLLAN